MDLFASDRPGHPTGAPSAAEPGSAPPPARAPHAGDLTLDDWGAPRDRPPTRRWLLVAAVAPWLVVAAMLAGGVVGGSDAPSPAPSAAPPTPSGPAATPAEPVATPSGAPVTASRTTTTATTTTGGVGDRGRAIGLAVTVARSWLSTRPSPLVLDGVEPSPGADARYLEHLVVESVDHPARGALVVTVRALVLPIEEQAYGRVDVVRAAVPVTLTDAGPRPGGPPWWLPTADAAPAPPATEPVEDPDLHLAAVDAITAAGYADVQLDGLQRSDGWAWIAHVTARAPGRSEVDTHAVWLRTDVGRFVVAGTPAPRDRPTTTPTEGPSTPADAPTPTGTPEPR